MIFNSKRKFWSLYLGCCLLGVAWLAFAGCSKQEQEVAQPLPRNAAEAGITVADSSQCETCHLSTEMIASFEKPKTGEAPVSEGG